MVGLKRNGKAIVRFKKMVACKGMKVNILRIRKLFIY